MTEFSGLTLGLVVQVPQDSWERDREQNIPEDWVTGRVPLLSVNLSRDADASATSWREHLALAVLDWLLVESRWKLKRFPRRLVNLRLGKKVKRVLERVASVRVTDSMLDCGECEELSVLLIGCRGGRDVGDIGGLK